MNVNIILSASVEKEPPFFTSPLLSHNADVVQGDTVHMECHFGPLTDPTIQIMWLFNGKSLVAGSRFVMTNDFGYVALDILQAIPEDSGLYTCKAINTKVSILNFFILFYILICSIGRRRNSNTNQRSALTKHRC